MEDVDPLRQAISKLLRGSRYSVIEATDRAAALDLIRGPRDVIDVLLLDLTLPGASSREILEEAAAAQHDSDCYKFKQQGDDGIGVAETRRTLHPEAIPAP